MVPVPGAVAIGTSIHVAPAGSMTSRFDLRKQVTGYFAADPTTALYETMARRPASTMSRAALSIRNLTTFKTTRPIRLFDLRPHAHDWPALQSPRYAPTWQLADDIRKTGGFDGIVYWSAQRHGADCYELSGASMQQLTVTATAPLVGPANTLHRAVVRALVGAEIALVP